MGVVWRGKRGRERGKARRDGKEMEEKRYKEEEIEGKRETLEREMRGGGEEHQGRIRIRNEVAYRQMERM